ncbi:expressed unknown protein [Seminavis robusta]|uniref:Uncharacterized protein n=1 Tax=Seminavis robusta TaxID=568900 RepID=A0A9N8E910_9STRA|nr:expressed unknown protein [Seminavis robusta]|eukprot:Sro680_g186260.1 n/a (237) ;mRNA; f:34905-35615
MASTSLIVSPGLLPTDWMHMPDTADWMQENFVEEMNVPKEFSNGCNSADATRKSDLESVASPRSTLIIQSNQKPVVLPEPVSSCVPPVDAPPQAPVHLKDMTKTTTMMSFTRFKSKRPKVKKCNSYSYPSVRASFSHFTGDTDTCTDGLNASSSSVTTPHASRSMPRPRRCNSFPTVVSPYWLEEQRLQQRRSKCEDSVRQLYEERKENIVEIFQNQWLISDDLDEYEYGDDEQQD